MAENLINVDPQARQAFGDKLNDFETNMKSVLASMKSRLDTASDVLADPGSQFYITEGKNLVEELEKLLDGSLSECGTSQKIKGKAQQELMDNFRNKMRK